MIDFPAIHIGNVTFDEIPQHGTIGEGYQKIYPKSKMQGVFFCEEKISEISCNVKTIGSCASVGSTDFGRRICVVESSW